MEEKIKQFVKQLNEKYPEYVASYTQGKNFTKYGEHLVHKNVSIVL